LEYWIPCEDLEAFNTSIASLITVTSEYHRDADTDSARD
jgi:hypothetical protein